MNTASFKFTEAAELYAKNFDIIQEIREEAFRSIADFGEKLLLQLPIELGTEHLCKKKTVSQGTYSGANIHYLWIGHDEKKEWGQQVGMAYFVTPIPERVYSEKQMQEWFGLFDLVSSHRLTIEVQYEGSSIPVRERIMDLAQERNLGELKKKDPDRFSLWIDLEPDNLVISAAKRLAVLLKAIKVAEKE